MTVRSAWLLPQGQSREDTRLTPTGTMASETEMRTRDGVLPGGAPFIATGASAMQVQIGVGRAAVQGTDAQGAYPVAITSPETLTVIDGNAQFNRIDAVVLRVLDGLYDTLGQTLARVEIVQGEATATPVAPSLPPAALRLWDISVPAGASAGTGGINWNTALADRRRFTTAVGGIIPRGWGSNWNGAYDGQYRDNGGTLERWNSAASAWLTYRPPMQVETTSSGATAATGFSVGLFTGRKVNGVCSLVIEVSRTGAQIEANSAGNITDAACATIPTGWRPANDVELIAGDGFGDGGARLNSAGALTLRTWSPNGAIASGRTIRMCPTFVQ